MSCIHDNDDDSKIYTDFTFLNQDDSLTEQSSSGVTISSIDISKNDKLETMSCKDKSGYEISQATGKLQKLIKWVKSKKCQLNTECKSIEKVQSKNKNVKVDCINHKGKTKTMSCSNSSGQVLSTKSGNIKDLILWVKSYQCQFGEDISR